MGYHVNVTIPSGGIMRIGRQQRVLGGDHSPVYSHHGKFAKINMWSKELDGSVIAALSSSPGAENGDAISWRDMRTALISRNVMVQDFASVQLTDDTITISYHTLTCLKVGLNLKIHHFLKLFWWLRFNFKPWQSIHF